MRPQINKKKLLSEVLEDAQESIDPVSSLKRDITDDPRLVYILGYAANPNFNISSVLPTGTPPHKESELPLELATLDPLKIHNQLYVLFRNDVKKIKKEELYIKWIEMMHPSDVKLMEAIKDQNIEIIYSKITKQVIGDALGWPKK